MKENEFKLVASGYNVAQSRLLIFYYEGVLVAPFENEPTVEKSFKVDFLLKWLTDDERNHVMVITSLEKEKISEVLKNDRLFLVAERGAVYKEPGGHWELVIHRHSTSWIPETFKALKTLEFQFEGSFVEQDERSVTWNYERVTDISKEDLRGIRNAMQQLPGHDSFVVADRGFAIQLKTMDTTDHSFLYHWLMIEPYDFVLTMAGDNDAEDLFQALGADIHSIRVGKANTSAARFRIESHTEALPFLKKLLDAYREFEQLMPFLNLSIYRLN